MSKIQSYKSTSKLSGLFVPIVGTVFSYLSIWALYTMPSNSVMTPRVFFFVILLLIGIFAIVGSTFLFDTIEINKDCIIINEHPIGGRKKSIYYWNQIQNVTVFRDEYYTTKKKYSVFLVIRTTDSENKHHIKHLDFDSKKVAVLVKEFSSIPDFDIEAFVNKYNNCK